MISICMRPSIRGVALCSSLFSWLKGQRLLWSQKKAEVDTESYTARIVSTGRGSQCEEADHSGHTSHCRHWDPSLWAVCVLLGSCPHLFISSWSLHLVLPFSDFGHSTTETASNRQVAVGVCMYVSLQVARTQKN
jgi:hypothetical protein